MVDMAIKGGPGGQWSDPNIELVPVDVLYRMRGNALRYDVSDLSEDIKKRGVQEPGVIRYYQQSRTAFLGEGNHRLEAAKRAGLTHMPVRVSRVNAEGRGVSVRGHDPAMGHVPADMKPSEIMDWDR